MMMVLLSIAFSTAILAFLCLGDPKRRRSVKLPGAAQGVAVRRLSALASLLPGMAYAIRGDGAAIFLWLGGYAMAGWLVTLAFAAARDWAERAEN
jgi:hypothetical protein